MQIARLLPDYDDDVGVAEKGSMYMEVRIHAENVSRVQESPGKAMRVSSRPDILVGPRGSIDIKGCESDFRGSGERGGELVETRREFEVSITVDELLTMVEVAVDARLLPRRGEAEIGRALEALRDLAHVLGIPAAPCGVSAPSRDES